MADKWMDERERRWRQRDRRGSEDMGRSDQRRFDGGEDRSFGGSVEDYENSFGAQRSGPGRDRVFGERETGMGYGGGGAGRGGGRGGAPRDRQAGSGRPPGWQDRDYQGVSPAMQNDEYELEHRAERYQRSHPVGRGGQGGGGRFYGDGGGERIYRAEYGQGGVEYGDVPRGYDAERGGRMASGGTGGYDYERGYGDGGLPRDGERRRDEDRGQRFERSGREAGDFFRRAGERVASWFGGDEAERDRSRDYRGLGPKGYKRADERISDEAHERLTDDPWVDATNISISVSGGEITLSGTVDSREAKHRAERCVEDIAGVNHVQNNLRLDRGNPLTSPSRGYGDSVLEHQMRGETGSGEAIPAARTAGGEASKSGGTNGSSTDTGKSR
ncbi:BON domain-containing protein [Phenylobacterium sp.]|uniref:BON domain-containing protein n=1 Tax=Phenylobacterium sp. TaxID=1871053 RepID=UPI002DE491BA|nr:BON domain-containing protein [Phenylobacterium sp.]